jgi:sugar O-acyltransferase (sialic acid O-acetyltransferase NeuD family)
MGIIIYGAGENGRIVLDILKCAKKAAIGFIDDNPALKGKEVSKLKVLGGFDYLKNLDKSKDSVIVSFGDNHLRKSKADLVKEQGFRLESAIHPRAIVAESVTLGENVIVVAGAVINPDAKIGRCVLINTGATVDHDCIIEEACHIAPGAHLAGGVHVRKLAFIGIGSSVIDDMIIGENSVIGAGSVIIREVPSNATVVGVPGKVIKSNVKGISPKKEKSN